MFDGIWYAVNIFLDIHQLLNNNLEMISKFPGRGGVLPYMGYIGMCGPKG